MSRTSRMSRMSVRMRPSVSAQATLLVTFYTIKYYCYYYCFILPDGSLLSPPPLLSLPRPAPPPYLPVFIVSVCSHSSNNNNTSSFYKQTSDLVELARGRLGREWDGLGGGAR